jgi:hypothetical protein
MWMLSSGPSDTLKALDDRFGRRVTAGRISTSEGTARLTRSTMDESAQDARGEGLGIRKAQLPRFAAAAIAVILVAMPVSAGTSPPAGIAPDSASYDYRCFYGPGMQIWQDINKGGASMIFCGNFGAWNDLSNQVAGLDFSANWNDRISSFEIFNTSVGGPHAWQLCTNSYEGGSCLGFYTTSVYVSYVGSTFNDKISSIRDARLIG